MHWASRVPEVIDSVVIGAGAVGLATARALARAGREVLVLEAETLIGSHTSSRNSEVIHAGIYYPTGSARARWCVAGKRALYAFCKDHGVPHRRCGKIIVATEDAHLDVLRDYQRRARANAAGELEWLDRDAVAELEPRIRALAAVHSPTTGIIDSHAYMLALQGDIEHHGGAVVVETPVVGARAHGDGIDVVTADLTLRAQHVVNSAGLAAVDLARSIDGLDLRHVPQAYYARGHYYSYSGASPFRRLVYPIAEAGGLGVHVTLDLAGQIRFGPDVQWIEAVDYSFDDGRRAQFVAAIRRYFPDLEPDRLQPGYTGVRPKISAPGEPAADFRLDGPAVHGIPGLVNLYGIESPGLTASLAIADAVLAALGLVP